MKVVYRDFVLSGGEDGFFHDAHLHRGKFSFHKRSLSFGRHLKQLSLLSLSFANEENKLNLGLD